LFFLLPYIKINIILILWRYIVTYTITTTLSELKHALPIELSVEECFNNPFHARLTVHSKTPLDLRALLYRTISCSINHQSLQSQINGTIHAVTHQPHHQYHYYILHITTKLHALSRNISYQLFSQCNPLEILKTVLKKHRITFAVNVSKTLPEFATITQYNESTLNFINRICGEFGLYYHFKHENKQHIMLIQDFPGVCKTTHEANKQKQQELNISRFEQLINITPRAVEYQAYNLNSPTKNLSVNAINKTTSSPVSQYQYHHLNKTHQQAQYQCELIQESNRDNPITYLMETHNPSLSTGHRIHLAQESSKVVIITQITHHYTFNSRVSREPVNHKYKNIIKAIAKTQQSIHIGNFNKPQAIGLKLAQAKSPAIGSENNIIHNDELSFAWDRSRSRPARQAQTQAGNQHGFKYTSREKHNNIIQYMHNDPDSPISIGELYDSIHPAPIKTTNHQANGIQTKTLNCRETEQKHALIFDDTPSQEQLKLHSSGSQKQITKQHFKQKSYGYIINQITSGNKTIYVNTGHLIITAASIGLKVGKSEIIIDPSGIHFKSPQITLTNNSSTTLPAARVNDSHKCPKYEGGTVPHEGGVISEGSPNVFINNQPAARDGDRLDCHISHAQIQTSDSPVLINGKSAARMNDLTSHYGIIEEGSPNVSL
jgi:type VI secretion system VgrG family protein